jgi:hypothetical protein
LLDCSLQAPVPIKGVFPLSEVRRKKTQLNVGFAVEVRRETRQGVMVMDLEGNRKPRKNDGTREQKKNINNYMPDDASKLLEANANPSPIEILELPTTAERKSKGSK